MSTTHTLAKEALLTQMKPFFPNLGLPGWPERWDSLAAFDHWQHEQYVNFMLPYWKLMAGAYQETLALPFGNDHGILETHVENWPSSVESQQENLYQCLHVSKLRTAWRGYKQREAAQPRLYAVIQCEELAELKRQISDAAKPLREIPLYQALSDQRISCQQVICMPVSTWKSMFCNGARYQPELIDRASVYRLATRIAQVFNAPPLVPLHLLHNLSGWAEATVWNASERILTCQNSNHGMKDRLEDEDGRRREGIDKLEFPEWRYEGFFGQIRVTLEDGMPWYVTVLAPMHFVRQLMMYAQ